MGLLFVGVVAGILIGYGFPLSSQMDFQECMSQVCSDRSAANQPMEPKVMASRPNQTGMEAKAATAAKPKKRSSANSGNRANSVKSARLSTRANALASERHAETSDRVLNRAKTLVAAKMNDPASAEFSDMKRATRKNTFGRPVDTICGHVREKTASGEETERPFLYLVKEDEAYVVDGKRDSAAAIAYRNICN
jgi:hypothetical protein